MAARAFRKDDDLASFLRGTDAVAHELAHRGCAAIAIHRDHAGRPQQAAEERDAH